MSRLRMDLAAWVGQRFFFGWVILAVAGLGIFVSGPGQSHTIGVFFGPIAAELDLSGGLAGRLMVWLGLGGAADLSRTVLSFAYGAATLVAAFLLPQMGKLVDLHGPRRMLAIACVLLGLACIAFAGATNVLWLTIGFGALRFFGQGSMMLNCANVVARWFSARRGFALSLMALGFAASMAAHPPLAQWLIDTVGWRQAWVWLGVLTWILMLPPVLLLVFNRPQEIGLRPDGEAAPAADSTETAAPVTGLTLSEALRTPAFYIIAGGLSTMSMLVTALHVYQVSIFGAHGLSAQTAARMFALSAVTMVVMMPVIGRLLDRVRTEFMFAGGLVIMVCSLLAATQVDDLATAAIYAMVFGLNNAVTMTYFSYMWPRYFGLAHLGRIQGMGQMIGVVGASLGPLPLGIAADVMGSYNPMLYALAVLPAACAILALTLRVPRQLTR